MPRTEARRLVTAVLTTLLTVPAPGLAGAVPARAAADHTQGVDATGSGSVRVRFTRAAPPGGRGRYLSPSPYASQIAGPYGQRVPGPYAQPGVVPQQPQR